MSARVGLLFLILFDFLFAAQKMAAESSVSAQMRATATVVVPFGFYGNLPEQSAGNADGSDNTIIDICHPKHAGIILTVNNYNGIIGQDRFPADARDSNLVEINKLERQLISLERVILFHNDYFFQDSCLITLIYSEN